MKLQQLTEASHVNQINVPSELRELLRYFEKVQDVEYENGMGSNWGVRDGFVVTYNRIAKSEIGGLDLYPNGDYTFVDDRLHEVSGPNALYDIKVHKTQQVYPSP